MSDSPSTTHIDGNTQIIQYDKEKHVIVKSCDKSDFYAVIAIDSIQRGPAIGGCRFLEYPTKMAAINDARELASAMTHKAALHDLPHGGGKAVIIKPSKPFDRSASLLAFSELLNEQSGRYITSLDSGTTAEDMKIIAQKTPFILGNHHAQHIPQATATGIRLAMEAAVNLHLNRPTVADLTIAIQGVGSVGYLLATQLHAKGAKLLLSDNNPDRIRHALSTLDAKIIPPDDILKEPCDILSPCALGHTISNAYELNCSIICGAANNQLENDLLADQLYERGIIYIPDFLANGGGLIFVANLYANQTLEFAIKEVQHIYQRSQSALTEANLKHQTPLTCINQWLSDKLLPH